MSKGKQGGPYPPLKEWAVTTFSLSEFHLNSILSKCCEKTQDPIEWLDVEDLSYLVHALEKFPWNHKLDATILKWILLPKKDTFWDMRTWTWLIIVSEGKQFWCSLLVTQKSRHCILSVTWWCNYYFPNTENC